MGKTKCDLTGLPASHGYGQVAECALCPNRLSLGNSCVEALAAITESKLLIPRSLQASTPRGGRLGRQPPLH